MRQYCGGNPIFVTLGALSVRNSTGTRARTQGSTPRRHAAGTRTVCSTQGEGGAPARPQHRQQSTLPRPAPPGATQPDSATDRVRGNARKASREAQCTRPAPPLARCRGSATRRHAHLGPALVQRRKLLPKRGCNVRRGRAGPALDHGLHPRLQDLVGEPPLARHGRHAQCSCRKCRPRPTSSAANAAVVASTGRGSAPELRRVEPGPGREVWARNTSNGTCSSRPSQRALQRGEAPAHARALALGSPFCAWRPVGAHRPPWPARPGGRTAQPARGRSGRDRPRQRAGLLSKPRSRRRWPVPASTAA